VSYHVLLLRPFRDFRAGTELAVAHLPVAALRVRNGVAQPVTAATALAVRGHLEHVRQLATAA
jgi:hypothetical protein